MTPGPGSRISGVYTITTPSGRVYVGSSVNVWTRFRQHRARLANGKHESKQLLYAWQKYGQALRFDLLIVCAKKHLMLYEQIAIDALKPQLNVGAALSGTLGRPRSPETKARIAAALRGRTRPPEVGQQISAIQMGRKRGPMTPQHRAAIASAKVAYYANRAKAT